METQRIKISELSCDPSNVRSHDGKNLDAIKASLQRFGQQKPIVVDEKGVVIAGNGTLTAARALGWDAINIVRTELAGAEATAYAIADNRTAELAEWDDEALAKQLSALQIEDEALVEAAGFSDKELTALVDEVTGITEGNTDPDEVPEVPEEPTAQPGQIWQLGNHRLMCGDSTSAEDVAVLMDGQKADMVFTDPPYGVNIQGGKNNKTIAGDLTQTAIPFSFDLAVSLATKKSARLYFCGGEGNIGLYTKLFERFCRQLPRHLIWVKESHNMKPNGYHNQYEIIYHGYKPGGGGLNNWFSGRKEDEASDVWQLRRDKRGDYVHPTQKPVALPARAIRNSAPPKGLVYEPFGGSGSTLIAAEQNNRTCYSMELDPAYCDVIIKRWEDFTGQTAELVNG